MRIERVTSRYGLLVAACVALALVELQWANALTWDEIEFFRATRWVAEGRVPYRDYWEHHTPLQWLLFAPFAKVLGGGAGVQAVLAMRWSQLLVWVATFVLLGRLTRRVTTDAVWPLAIALSLLLSTPSFVRTAVQYRVDAVGNLLLIGALTLILARRWIAFGAVMSLAVLTNMRLAPLAILVAAGVVFDRREWLARTWKIAAGVAGVAAAFLATLFATGTWPAFVECILVYNRDANRLSGANAPPNMLLPILATPFHEGELSGIALWAIAMGGLWIALREFRRRGVLQVLALVWIAAMIVVALPGVQYDYHLQSVWLLMVPLAAVALERIAPRIPRAALIASAIVVVALVLGVVRMGTGSLGAELAYQDRIMTEADRRVPPDGRVWDGTGYALRREPAYRYWFLPSGVRLMAEAGVIERYDIRRRPPDLIVHNYRTHNWMIAFQDVGRFATSHYVPLYRNLWIPGFSTSVPTTGLHWSWTVVKSGQYDIWVSPMLAKHPWFSRPLRYALIEGPDAPLMQIPLDRLPRDVEGRVQWLVDGVAVPAGARTLVLREGSQLEMRAGPGAAVGVLVVPTGTRTLCMAPPEKFTF
ncbi:MAG TPA: hypothetical protein VNI54_07775 [Thermoanaerobaculia bacterium]|nr:hypothetical protein [Thermoanaerobaculia bacterium]